MATHGKIKGIKESKRQGFSEEDLSNAMAKRKEIIQQGIANQKPSQVPRYIREAQPVKTGDDYFRDYYTEWLNWSKKKEIFRGNK